MKDHFVSSAWMPGNGIRTFYETQFLAAIFLIIQIIFSFFKNKIQQYHLVIFQIFSLFDCLLLIVFLHNFANPQIILPCTLHDLFL